MNLLPAINGVYMLSESTSALSIAARVWAEDNMLTASRKMSKRSNFITSKMGFPSIHILASNKGKWQFLLWVSNNSLREG